MSGLTSVVVVVVVAVAVWSRRTWVLTQVPCLLSFLRALVVIPVWVGDTDRSVHLVECCRCMAWEWDVALEMVVTRYAE
jgi:hypothetical protein